MYPYVPHRVPLLIFIHYISVRTNFCLPLDHVRSLAVLGSHSCCLWALRCMVTFRPAQVHIVLGQHVTLKLHNNFVCTGTTHEDLDRGFWKNTNQSLYITTISTGRWM